MRTLLIGSGAVGIGIATALWDAHITVDIVARKNTKTAIEKYGLKRTGIFKEVSVPAGNVNVYEDVKEIPKSVYDFIIISTKTTQSARVFKDLSQCKELLSPKGKIIIIQNGLEDEAIYLPYFEKSQIYSSRVFIGFTRPEPYISEVTVYSSGLLIGSLYGHSIDPIQPLADAIEKGGIPCKTAPEIGKSIWAKMLYNCALNPLGAILQVKYGKLVENNHSIEIMGKIIEEVFAVMKASGHETFWENAEIYKKHFLEKLVPATKDHRSSTLQDIERNIKTEIDSLSGAIIKLGRAYKVDVPYNQMIYDLIKAKESCFIEQRY